MIHEWIDTKTKAIGFVNAAYQKASGWIYSYANRDVTGQQAQSQGQPQQAQNWLLDDDILQL